MKYAQYTSDGKIEKTGSSPPAVLDFMRSRGHLVISISADEVVSDTTHYVSEGVAVPMPPRPSQFHIFDYTVKQWIDPRTPETEWPLVRRERDRRLLASDWTQLPDVPIATKDAWAVYRQALRDITEQPDPFNIVWPVPPA